MHNGITANELREKLESQAARKADYKVPDGAMRFVIPADSDVPRLDVQGLGDVGILPLAHRQVRDRLGIPAKYYARCLDDAPDLLCRNVNHWLAKSDKTRLLRTLDGDARAVLGDTYRPMDNLDFMAAIAKGLATSGGDTEIRSAEVTDERIYIKVTTPRLESDLLPPEWTGDGAVDPEAARALGLEEANQGHGGEHFFLKTPEPVRGGACFSNSEVGCGGLNVDGFVEVLRCTNAYKSKEPIFRKVHIGGQRSKDELLREFIRDETQALADRALWEEVSDVVAGVFDAENFDRVIRMFVGARGRDTAARPDAIAEVVRDRFLLTEGERDAVLDQFIRGGELTQFGIAQAVTRVAGTVVEDYGRATELETVGYQIVELPDREWERFNVDATKVH